MGGRASRFGGRDKSTLRVGGRTIFERQLDALTPLSDDILIIGGRPPIDAPGVRIVNDRHPGLGPLAGLEAALDAARDDAVVLLACDMPLVTTALLAHLLALAPQADAVVPQTDRGYHPLCAVYNRRCLSTVRHRLDARALALNGLLQEITVRAVGSDELERFGREVRLLANANTPSDLDEIESFLNHEL